MKLYPHVLTSLLTIVAASPAVATSPVVHTVRQGESISAALDRAGAGDTLRLTGTEYRETLVIDVPIVLSGVDLPLIRGGYEGNVIHVTAPGTVIEGVHVSEASPLLTKDMACILIEADSVVVRNSVISEALHGIYVKAGNGARIENNRIQGRRDLIEADRGNGIHLWNSEGNRIADNEIFDVRDGIYFSFAHSTQVERNHVHDVRYGLHYMYSNQNTFYDNLFESNVAGAALMYSEQIVFERNTFARCRGYRAYGILLQSMNRVEARSNLILDNSRGIFLNNSDDNVFEHNDVVDNDLAIQLNGGCDGNRLLRNNFLDNLTELLLDVSDRGTRWSDEAGGNHWSRYRGYDLDGDGIGDVPFSIQNVFQVMESRLPEARFYLLSPAADLLEAAERALPILNLGEASDPRPLMLPAANREVPWDVGETRVGEASPLWAGAYVAGACVPLWMLVLFSRTVPRAGRRRRSQ